MDRTEAFEQERPRLVRLAGRMLADDAEAEDVAQRAWLRLHNTTAEIDNLPAWLTTVTTRLCLDRLRKRTPLPMSGLGGPDDHWEPAVARAEGTPGRSAPAEDAGDPAEQVALAETVGAALQVVLDRLSPNERVAFVLHDSFGFDFATIAAILDTTPAAARKLASRARAKVTAHQAHGRADWEVVDAFMAAARDGDFTALVALLAPDAQVGADAFAVEVGTPAAIVGRQDVATFFDGAASAALPVFLGERPGAAWFDRGTPRVAFDFTVVEGQVARIDFRADPAVLAGLARRRDGERRT